MRPDRFRDCAVEAYRAAGLTAEPWTDGTRRPFGVKVTLPSGAQIWHAVTVQSPEGDDPNQPEKIVRGAAPEAVELPDLSGRSSVQAVEEFLAGAVANSGNEEISGVYAYSASRSGSSSVYPGFGVKFHSGAKIYCVFVRAGAPGREPGSEYDIPKEI
ncbi:MULTISPECIES: hypothetical protein [unclassified Streptomyces]|uniref:hypothetical protein n=1 Tax=unclassified Streptomyces TaxID=2593676 RepID=UPI0011B0D00D|nr:MULTISPECIES: hypothetical protein [unclassified Streptomyces]